MTIDKIQQIFPDATHESDKESKNAEQNNNETELLELASKYNKGDSIPMTFSESLKVADRYEIILEGKKIGIFTLVNPEIFGRKSDVKAKQIGYINIKDVFRGKGIGKQFYIKLNEHLKTGDGSVLESGDSTTEGADGVWSSLFKDDLVEKVGLGGNKKDLFRFK